MTITRITAGWRRQPKKNQPERFRRIIDNAIVEKRPGASGFQIWPDPAGSPLRGVYRSARAAMEAADRRTPARIDT